MCLENALVSPSQLTQKIKPYSWLTELTEQWDIHTVFNRNGWKLVKEKSKYHCRTTKHSSPVLERNGEQRCMENGETRNVKRKSGEGRAGIVHVCLNWPSENPETTNSKR